MSRTAYISDVHSNSDALRRVLHEIDARGVQDIVCLGDLVGYGGNDPAGVIDMIRMRCVVCLLGAEDAAFIHGNPTFNPVTQAGISNSRRLLDPGSDSTGSNQARIDFLAGLRPSLHRGTFLLVHATPQDPLHEYLLPHSMQFDPTRVANLLKGLDAIGIAGHTHVPGAFVEGVGYVRPEDVNGKLMFQGRKTFVQVGSVGRPLDGTGLPCFAVIDEEGVEWTRVADRM